MACGELTRCHPECHGCPQVLPIILRQKMLLKKCLSASSKNENCDTGALNPASKNTCLISELSYTDGWRSGGKRANLDVSRLSFPHIQGVLISGCGKHHFFPGWRIAATATVMLPESILWESRALDFRDIITKNHAHCWKFHAWTIAILTSRPQRLEPSFAVRTTDCKAKMPRTLRGARAGAFAQFFPTASCESSSLLSSPGSAAALLLPFGAQYSKHQPCPQLPPARSQHTSLKQVSQKKKPTKKQRCLARFAASPVSKAFFSRGTREDEISLPVQDKTIFE